VTVRDALRHSYLTARGLALAPLALLRRRRPLPARCRKILLVRIDRIGDLVLTTPFLRNTREFFSSAEIVLLGRGFARELLAGGRLVDRILALDDPSDAAADLARERFDLAIDLHYDYVLRTALLARRARAACTVGFDVAGRGVLFDIPVPAREPKHSIEESLDILRALGHQPKRHPLELDLPPEAPAQARRLLAEQGVKTAYASIHPGGYYRSQRWPAARFAAVADAMLAMGLRPVLLGTAGDRRLVEEVTRRMRSRPAVLSGAPLSIAAAVIGGSRLFVGNNSGPLHIACALGVPSVSTMGPTDPIRFHPVSDRARVLRAGRVDAISAEEMLIAVRSVLASAGGL
jgi:ADP-heptose:LPS heptosyltransferase